MERSGRGRTAHSGNLRHRAIEPVVGERQPRYQADQLPAPS